jgi:hypothetical protein
MGTKESFSRALPFHALIPARRPHQLGVAPYALKNTIAGSPGMPIEGTSFAASGKADQGVLIAHGDAASGYSLYLEGRKFFLIAGQPDCESVVPAHAGPPGRLYPSLSRPLLRPSLQIEKRCNAVAS